MAISDPKALAAGDLFRVSQSVANTGDATAAIRLVDSAAASDTIPALDALLVNNVNDDAAVSVSTSYSLAKMILPAGTADLELSMSKGVNSDAQLQVFTRDGRHLFGSALTSAQRGVMLSEQNGFVAGSTYSNTYLNGATSLSRRDLVHGQSRQGINHNRGRWQCGRNRRSAIEW